MNVSVCIPVYNVAPHYLKATIDSVLRLRDEATLEIIINDDVSEVDYQEVIRSYPEGLIKYYRNTENQGMVGNWNTTIRRSTGTLAMILGHDDLVCKGMFSTFVSTFERDADVALCACQKQFINEAGQPFTPKRNVNDRTNIFIEKEIYELSHLEVAELCLRNGNAIGEPSCTMFHRAGYEHIGGYDESFFHAADVDFNIRMSRLGKTIFHNKVLCQRRIHEDNLTFTNLRTGRVTSDRIRIFERFANESLFSADQMKAFKAFLVASSSFDAYRNIRRGHWPAARYAIQTMKRFFQFNPGIYAAYLKEIIGGQNRSAM